MIGKKKIHILQEAESKAGERQGYVLQTNDNSVWFRSVLEYERSNVGFFWVLNKVNQQKKGHELKDKTERMNSDISSNHFTI